MAKRTTNLRWRNLTIRNKRKIFEVTQEIVKPSGFRIPVFNYFSLESYAKIFEQLMAHCKRKGLTKSAIVHHWSSKTGSKQCDIRAMLEGSKMLEVYELLLVFDAFGVKWKLDFEENDNYNETRYSSDVQTSSQGSKLILRSNGYISFVMVLNLDDYNDWEVTFRKGIVAAAVFKYRKEVLSALYWYFCEQTGKKKLPFDENKFKVAFHNKWLQKEIKIVSQI